MTMCDIIDELNFYQHCENFKSRNNFAINTIIIIIIIIIM